MARNITDEELALLESVQTEDQWQSACLQIKRARGGIYPSDWWPRVKNSGLMDRVMDRYSGPAMLKAFGIQLGEQQEADVCPTEPHHQKSKHHD